MYQALLRIHKNKGVEFDSHAVDLFVKTLGLYPVGSLVELNTSELGVVFQPNVDDSRRPVVGLVTLPSGRERGAPFIVDLARRAQSDGREITRVLDPEKLDVDVEQIMADVETRGERTERMRR